MKFLWGKQMVNKAELLFTVPVGMPFFTGVKWTSSGVFSFYCILQGLDRALESQGKWTDSGKNPIPEAGVWGGGEVADRICYYGIEVVPSSIRD